MNPSHWKLPIILGLVIAVLGVLVLVVPSKAPVEEAPSAPHSPPVSGGPVGIPDLIVIESPLPDQVIKSPVTVRGRARGSWFFEASFPVSIVDASGEELARVPVMTAEEWMTTDFVEFSGQVTFKEPFTDIGKIVFEKDNPSGLPEHDRKFEMPVRFQ